MPEERVPRLPVLDWHYLRPADSPETVGSVLDAPYRLWTTSGRAAIALALHELQVRAGDRILLPTYHCATMVAPAAYLGCDIEYYPLTPAGLADIEEIARLLRSRPVRALLVAHYFGFPQSLREIRALCDRFGVALIEDCAHAMFGLADDAPIGSWGDFAITSLTKFFPVNAGGCLVSHRRPLTLRMRRPSRTINEIKSRIDSLEIAISHRRLAGVGAPLRWLFAAKNRLRGAHPRASLEPTSRDQAGADYFSFNEALAFTAPPSFVTRMAEKIHRATIVERRRAIFRQLFEAAASIPGVRTPKTGLPPTVAPYVFPLLCERADHVFQQMRHHGIPVFRWDWLWPGTPELDDDLGHEWSRSLLQLPCHQDLNETDIRLIISALRASCEPT